jgi:hypothetical protein
MLLSGIVEKLVELMGKKLIFQTKTFLRLLQLIEKFFIYLYRWKDDDVFESSTNDTVSYPIFHLQPFTRYAFYVQAFIIETENINALSEVKYFRTKPGQPAPIPSKKFTVTVHNSSSIVSLLFVNS